MSKHKVIGADLDVTGSTIKLSVDFDFGPDTTDLILKHDKPDVQAEGRAGFDFFVWGCDIPQPDDTSELLGCTISRSAWDVVKQYSYRQNGMIGGSEPEPKVKRVLAPETADPIDGRYVYVISCLDSEAPLCKIGIANSPEKRLRQLSTSSPHQLRIEAAMYSPEAAAVEAAAHLHFSSRRRNGEWFAMPSNLAIAFVHDHVSGKNSA